MNLSFQGEAAWRERVQEREWLLSHLDHLMTACRSINNERDEAQKELALTQAKLKLVQTEMNLRPPVKEIVFGNAIEVELLHTLLMIRR